MSIMRRLLTRVGMTIILLAGSGVSHAQMGYTQASIEWLVADSDVVVRASVVDVSPERPDREREELVWKTITVDVHETLKGSHVKLLDFAYLSHAQARMFEDLKHSRREFLCFLMRGDRHPDAMGEEEMARVHVLGWMNSLVRLGPPIPEHRLPPPLFTVDLRLLKEPAEVLRAARAAVAEEGKGRRATNHGVTLPRGIMQATGRSGDANLLVVPVDPRLEAAARRWIESPGAIPRRLGVVEAGDDRNLRHYADSLRLEGVRALRHFRSDENAAILKGMLGDDAFWHHTIGEGQQAGVTEKVYYIRKEAFETLRGWGVEVNEPVLTEPVPRE